MKKICFLFTLCLLNFAASAITVTVNATGAVGSYTTGYTEATSTRTDGNMVIASTATPAPRRGYAVFNLNGVLPTGATVSAVNIRFNFTTSTAGLGVGCNIGGFAGDISTIAIPATIWADCASGAAFNTTNWGASLTGAQDLLPFNVTGTTFIQTNAGLKVSIGFYTTSGTNIYTITGEGGTIATQPQLQITYTCTGVSGVSATAPANVCAGNAMTLTGAGAGITSYLWSGPGGYTSTSLSPALTASLSGTGVYTLTAYNAGGCGTTVTTSPVIVNPLPPAITGPGTACTHTTIGLSSGGVGTWSSSSTAVATVGTGSGIVTGVIPGTTHITFTNTNGCSVSTIVTVNLSPVPITGIPSVCVGDTTTLIDSTTGGIWTTGSTAIATLIGPGGKFVGLTAGIAIISYSNSICSATVPLFVNAAPVPVTGGLRACPLTSTTLSETSTGGIWTSGNTVIATVGSLTGIVTGASAGTVGITYSNGCGPNMSAVVTINPLPVPVTGFPLICLSSTTTFVDTTIAGLWSATPTAIATVGTAGVVSGVALGAATVTYTLPATGCYVTRGVTVNNTPAPVTAVDTVVCQTFSITYLDAVTGGIWTSDNTAIATTAGSSGIITGASMGATTITYTTGANCYVTKAVSVNPWAPIAGRDSVCQGLTAYITDIVGGGTWSSSNLPVATVRIDSGKVSGLTPGLTIITYLLPTGCVATTPFHIVAFPGAITGATQQVCPGQAISFTDPSPGGTWSSNNNGIATVGALTGVVTGAVADTVSIIYATQPGCPVYTLVTVNPLPDPIVQNLVLCPGAIDSLQDLTPGGLWGTTTPSLATIVDTSGIITAIAGGAAIISYKLPVTGCFVTTTVSVNPAPVPGVIYYAPWNSFIADSGYVTYQWYDSIVGLLPGATSTTLAALYNEYYYVVVTDSFGCQGASALLHYTPVGVGVKNITGNSGIEIYPNPSNGTLYIQSGKNVRAVISGIDGKQEIEQSGAKEIDVSMLADGMYFIALYDDSGQRLTVQKFIKQ